MANRPYFSQGARTVVKSCEEKLSPPGDDGRVLQDPRDFIDHVLGSVKVADRSFYYAKINGSWAVELVPSSLAAVHYVESGRGYVRCTKSRQVTLLAQGDLVIVPRGGGHVMGDQVGTPPIPIDDFISRAQQPHAPQVLLRPGDGPETVLACGLFSLEYGQSALWGLLPEVVVVVSQGKANTQERSWLGDAFRDLVWESTNPKPGSEAIVAEAIDLVFQMGVRDWLRERPEMVRGWFAALSDPCVGKVIEAIHGQIEHNWTLEEMACLAGLSRSRFSTRFASLTGLTPASYITQHRLWKALRLLRGGNEALDQVAEQVGYSCGSALRKAMVRWFGSLPRELR